MINWEYLHLVDWACLHIWDYLNNWKESRICVICCRFTIYKAGEAPSTVAMMSSWCSISFIKVGSNWKNEFSPQQLEDVGDPLDRVAQDEDEDDGQADFGQQHLVLLRWRLEGRGMRTQERRRVPAPGVVVDHREALQGQEVEDDQEDEWTQAHEDEVHPDAINLKFGDKGIRLNPDLSY